MKKNKMMRIASVLLIAVMMSTCAISGTFAKYVTSDSASDSARVAKWGVVVEGNSNAFAEEYDSVSDGNDASIETTGTVTVSSDKSHGNVNDLVAPGTNGEMTAIKLSGNPEVSVNVKYDATVTLNDQWLDADGNFYCPLIIKITNGASEKSINGTAYTDAAVFLYDIENAIESVNKSYDPNTDLSAIESGAELVITWEWPFYVSDANDVKDTYLGDSAAGMNNGKSAATISIDVICTVTQID